MGLRAAINMAAFQRQRRSRPAEPAAVLSSDWCSLPPPILRDIVGVAANIAAELCEVSDEAARAFAHTFNADATYRRAGCIRRYACRRAAWVVCGVASVCRELRAALDGDTIWHTLCRARFWLFRELRVQLPETPLHSGTTHRDVFVALSQLEDSRSVFLSQAFVDQVHEDDETETKRLLFMEARAARQPGRLPDDDPKVTLLDAIGRLRGRGVTEEDALGSAMDRADIMTLLAANPLPRCVLAEDFLFTFQLTFDEHLIGCKTISLGCNGCGEVSLFDKDNVPWCFRSSTAWGDVDWNLLRLRVFVTNPASWCTSLIYDWKLEDPHGHLLFAFKDLAKEHSVLEDDHMAFELEATSLPIVYGDASGGDMPSGPWEADEGPCTCDGRLKIYTECIGHSDCADPFTFECADPFCMSQTLHHWVSAEACAQARARHVPEQWRRLYFSFEGDGDGRGGMGPWTGGGFNGVRFWEIGTVDENWNGE